MGCLLAILVLLFGVGVAIPAGAALSPTTSPAPSQLVLASPETPVLPVPSGPLMCGEYRLVGVDGAADPAALSSQTRTVLIERLATIGVADPLVEARDDGTVVLEAQAAEPLLREVIGARGDVAFVPVPLDLDESVEDGRPAPPAMAAIEPLFTRDGLEEVHAVFDDLGMPAIELRLNADAARIFDEHAAAHLGERFAIVVDGLIVSAPSINVGEFGGEMRISGSMEPEEAVALVAVLGSGALPAPLEEVRLGPCPDGR